MAETPTPGSPEWWLTTLRKRLSEERRGLEWDRTRRSRTPKGQPGLDLLKSYMDGTPPLSKVANGWRDSLQHFVRMSRLNVADLIVGAAADRMVPIGWTTAVENDQDGDAKAAEVAAVNHLDIVGADMARNMLGRRRGVLMVSEPRPGGTIPTITSEDPATVLTAHDPRTNVVVAAIKEGIDEWTGKDMAWLYLPGRVYTARVPERRRRLELDGGQRLPKVFRESIPIFVARNADGVGEFERHLDTLDRINDGIFMRIAIAKYQAFRQRGVKGLPEKDPITGEDIDYSEIFTTDPGAMWQLPETAEMWESQSVDLGPIRMAIKDDLEHAAAVTRTPLHMVNPDAASGSAEGATTMREGHTFRVRDRRRRANVAMAECISATLRAMGESKRADLSKIRTLWEPIELTSLTGRASAMRDAKQAGMPFEAIAMDFGGYEPGDLPRLRVARTNDLIFQAPQVSGSGAPS